MHIFIYTYTCIYICKYQKATQKSTKALKRFLRALRQLCRSRFRLNLCHDKYLQCTSYMYPTYRDKTSILT